MYSNWILQLNLVAWLEVLSGIIGYEFDSWDRDAFESGVANSDSERKRWFEYELAGRINFPLKVAQDVGTEVLLVRVTRPGNLEPRIDAATGIAKESKLVR